MRKIIHLYYRAAGSYFPPRDSDYYYLAGWSGAIARRTVEFTDRYRVENWRPDREVERPVCRDVRGVTCRIFPAIHVPYFGDYSPSLLQELKKQSRDHDILIHHNGIHSNPLYLTSFIFRYLPIIAQHHGDSPSLVRFRQNGRLLNLLSALIERKALVNIDHFFVLRNSESSFLADFLPQSHITMQTVGVDYGQFSPIDKIAAKRELGIRGEVPVMLYIGKFYRLKGVDLILDTYQRLKREMDVELVLIGGSSGDELYDKARTSGARCYGYLPHDVLPKYISAADVYLLPAFAQNYWGIDVAVIESLACGVPVVSTILGEFPEKIRAGLGEVPKDKQDFVRCVRTVFDNPLKYAKCREISRVYYNWPSVIQKTTEVYDSLFMKYYDGRVEYGK